MRDQRDGAEGGLAEAAFSLHTQDNDLQTLRFVRRARDLGFTVKQIDDLLTLWRDRTRASASVKEIALGHVAALEKKMQELKEMSDYVARAEYGEGFAEIIEYMLREKML